MARPAHGTATGAAGGIGSLGHLGKAMPAATVGRESTAFGWVEKDTAVLWDHYMPYSPSKTAGIHWKQE